MQDKTTRMKELVEILNKAGKAYYQESNEIMSNLEYDALYDELAALENETGITLSNSPTIHVGYEVLSELPKESHDQPMLSLDKTKEVEVLHSFLGNKTGILSWKLDGLTVVLTYRNGKLAKAVTRGNGQIGEVITNNAKVFKNLPVSIGYQGELILRGEAVIKYSDFNRINEKIDDVDAKYKNPRNLCSGTVRQLNNKITAEREVHYYAFSLIKAEGVDFDNSYIKQFAWLQQQGFEVVEHRMVTADSLADEVQYFAKSISDHDIPSDGLVLLLDDITYGQSLGTTAKFPRNAIAFKWADELSQTKLIEIEWSPSRTGLINPVAIFEPVELEGTTVSRASVHNLSILQALALGEGDTIEVYKANMIIPQIAENLTRSGVQNIPSECPACGSPTEIRSVNDVKSLYCVNEDCSAKKIKSFTHFVSRDAMNIDGLSEETLVKLIAKGFIHNYVDIYHLDHHENEIVNMKGFGRKSYDNLIKSVDTSRNTTFSRFIYSLGILNVGVANAKMIGKQFHQDIQALRNATEEQLTQISGVGEVIAGTIVNFFANTNNQEIVDALLKEVHIEQEESQPESDIMAGKTFVITGSVEQFTNRNEVKDLIESLGGKVTGSVTAKTDFLINNDSTSSSSKNKKAKELGIPIITEAEFIEMLPESMKPVAGGN